MAAKQKEYRRLPPFFGRRRGVGLISVSTTSCWLWLGKDHLLCIDRVWFKEDYKRFYFRDIQAIVIRKTENGRIANIVFGALATPPLIAALVTSGGWQVAWFIVTGFFLALMLINFLYGPTSACHLRTAVQTEELPSLKRLRRARKVLARLRPLIAAAQGELASAEVPVLMAELARPPVAVAPAASPAPEAIFQPPSANPQP
ncbi:MAG: hypothetical protein JWQ04_987 [Pedosphaera sp.]|nr:hypothetical protein [Pedosphaera sp.]